LVQAAIPEVKIWQRAAADMIGLGAGPGHLFVPAVIKLSIARKLAARGRRAKARFLASAEQRANKDSLRTVTPYVTLIGS
jgi:hypothetical protein